MEDKETLVDASIREVREETGIEVKRENMQVFALWESVYPTFIEIGLPSRHHLIVYHLAKITSKDVEKLKLQPDEVEAAAWISKKTIVEALSSDKKLGENTFEGVLLTKEGLKKKQFKISELQRVGLNSKNAHSMPRLTTATRFVLKQYLQTFHH